MAKPEQKVIVLPYDKAKTLIETGSVSVTNESGTTVTLDYDENTVILIEEEEYLPNLNVRKTIVLTQAEFDALAEYEDNTDYEVI